MKKLLYVVIIMGGSIVFTSCGSDECVCDSGITITEDDAEDAGATLSEACSLAEIGGASCAIE